MVSVLQPPDSERLASSRQDVGPVRAAPDRKVRRMAIELRRLHAENGRLRESNDQLRGEVAELRDLIEELDPSGQGRYCWWLYGSATA